MNQGSAVTISERFKARLKKSLQRERFLEKPMETVSRVIWPYSFGKLFFLVSLMPALDCVSTFAALKLSGKNIHESGPIGKWALGTVGFTGMFVIEMACIGLLMLTALALRKMYGRLGFDGFGRAAWVLILAPTFVAVLAAVLNNVILTLL